MSSVIIFEKDLKKLGRKLMKEFYHQICDEYMLTFDEVKLKRKYFDENITKKYLSFENQQKIIRSDLNKIKTEDLLKEIKTEDLLKEIKTQIKDETLNYKLIYMFFTLMDLNLKIDKSIDFELNEDLFCLKKTFINIFDTFHHEAYKLEI